MLRGQKTVRFVNFFELSDQVDSIVDINPRKQGFSGRGAGIRSCHLDALVRNPSDTFEFLPWASRANLTEYDLSDVAERQLLLPVLPGRGFSTSVVGVGV